MVFSTSGLTATSLEFLLIQCGNLVLCGTTALGQNGFCSLALHCLETSNLHQTRTSNLMLLPVVKEEIQWSNLMLLPHSKPRCARKRSSGEIAAKLQANQIVFVSDIQQRGSFPSPPRCARKRSSGERLAKELNSKPLFLSEIVEPLPSQIVFVSEMQTQCKHIKIEH